MIALDCSSDAQGPTAFCLKVQGIVLFQWTCQLALWVIPWFCCRASEQAELDNAKASSTGGKTASEASSHGSWAGAITGGQSQHPRHSKSAPIMHVVDKVKAAIPEAMKYKRSSTAPEFETQLPSAKETGRLRVEKFRVSDHPCCCLKYKT